MTVPFTLDQLEVLEAICRLGSFAAAAKHLHRATSAVSYSVKSLESALGVVVFDRSGRTARLTPAGALALEAARDVLARSRGLERLGKDLHGGWEPQLRIVFDGVLPQAPVMRAARRFIDRHLPTTIRLMVEYLSGVRRRFERENAQLMLAIESRGDPRLASRALPPVEMVLLARRDHPMHGGRKAVTRDDLREHVELLVADSGDRDEPPPNQLAFIGSAQVFELTDFQSKREALLSGVGFGWLPSHLASDAATRRALARVRFEEGDRYVLQPSLFHRRDAPLGPAARCFLEDLEHELRCAAPRQP